MQFADRQRLERHFAIVVEIERRARLRNRECGAARRRKRGVRTERHGSGGDIHPIHVQFPAEEVVAAVERNRAVARPVVREPHGFRRILHLERHIAANGHREVLALRKVG